jgi:cell division protein FtsI (penicillin-binding protein 3)
VRATGRARVAALTGVLGFAMLGTGARGVQLAISPDPRTLEIAMDTRYAGGTLRGPRGEIVDSRGQLLAKSVLTPAVSVDALTLWERVYDEVHEAYKRDARLRKIEVDEDLVRTEANRRLSQIAAWLAPQLEMELDEVEQKLRCGKSYCRLRPFVHPAVADAIEAEGLPSKGLIIEENYTRFYPQGAVAGQMLGYVDVHGAGVQGVELSMEDALAGSEVREHHRVNRYGAWLDRDRNHELGMRGKRVVLTIDGLIQADLEQALMGIMEEHRPLWAAAVVVEVETGRIVGMATVPGFDPNHPSKQAYSLMRNRVILDPVEPGSVFKSFTYAAAIEEGVTRPDEIFQTPSPYSVGDKRIRDDHPHGSMTAEHIIKYSSNVGAAQLAERLGAQRLLSYYEAFGFGEKTGVPLPAEERGVRSPPRVGPVETATISYGQGVTATLMQLALGTATIANDGVRMQPILVDRVEDAEGHVVRAWTPTVVAEVISPETAEIVTRAMAQVTQDDSTAPRARIAGYRVAGKTGTAYKVVDGQYSTTARYSSFIGFAPAEDPVYAMAILVDEPSMGARFGGIVAAPAFPEVVGPALLRRGVPQDVSVPGARGSISGTIEDPRRVIAALRGVDGSAADADGSVPDVKLVWTGEGWSMPDLRGRDARTALSGLQGAGVVVELQGSGFVSEQTPPAGSVLRPGDRVLLFLSP